MPCDVCTTLQHKHVACKLCKIESLLACIEWCCTDSTTLYQLVVISFSSNFVAQLGVPGALPVLNNLLLRQISVKHPAAVAWAQWY
jgi:hypothetical protein